MQCHAFRRPGGQHRLRRRDVQEGGKLSLGIDQASGNIEYRKSGFRESRPGFIDQQNSALGPDIPQFSCNRSKHGIHQVPVLCCHGLFRAGNPLLLSCCPGGKIKAGNIVLKEHVLLSVLSDQICPGPHVFPSGDGDPLRIVGIGANGAKIILSPIFGFRILRKASFEEITVDLCRFLIHPGQVLKLCLAFPDHLTEDALFYHGPSITHAFPPSCLYSLAHFLFQILVIVHSGKS